MADVSFNISNSSTCDAELTGGSAEEAAFSSLSKTIWSRVWVATVPFLPPFKLRPCPWPKFPRFDHFWGLKIIRLAQLFVVQLQMTLSLYWWRQGCLYASALYYFDKRWRCFTLNTIWEKEIQEMYICFRSCFIQFKLQLFFSIVSRCMLSVTHHPIW